VPFVRVDVGRLTVEEGNAGTRVVRLPLTVTGRLTKAARVFVTGADVGTSIGGVRLPAVIRIPAGARRLDVEVPVVGNTLDDEDLSQVPVFVRGVHDAVGGDWAGGVVVADDDPSPALTITPAAATATEGGTLTWTVTLAAPSNRFLFVPFVVQPVAAPGKELDTDDVTAQFLLENLGLETRPVPPVPLSQTGLFLAAFLEPGVTTATVEIPTAADRRAEGAEKVAVRVPAADELFPGDPGVPGLPGGADLTGTVTDRP
jgi:hypothetical protein